ncbi:MAG: hypothetical protein EOP55_05000 [Sphingobacteriales bacterium]|nr:MAG: hypothetical protein EOP55_05000 [Sphingobacteriales bacterium]
MKKLLSLILISSLAFGCKNHSSGVDRKADSIANATNGNAIDTDSITLVPHEPIADTVKTKSRETADDAEISYADSIDFGKFYVELQKNQTSRASIDWSSYPEAGAFKTRITEAYKTSEISFGGHYVSAVFGCGASCIMGFMVDVRDGKIYDLPLGEENSCLFAEDRALYTTTSKLFIAGICKENNEDTSVYYKAYLWDESKKEFSGIKPEEFLKKK